VIDRDTRRATANLHRDRNQCLNGIYRGEVSPVFAALEAPEDLLTGHIQEVYNNT
jgi:hypothetical protein